MMSTTITRRVIFGASLGGLAIDPSAARAGGIPGVREVFAIIIWTHRAYPADQWRCRSAVG
jgi:hypothetical protein